VEWPSIGVSGKSPRRRHIKAYAEERQRSQGRREAVNPLSILPLQATKGAGDRGDTILSARMARTSIIVTSGPHPEVTASVTSALDQTDADLEVVVVEGRAAGAGSEVDAGDARVRRLASDDPDFATQVNRALATVRSPLVKLLPAGDRLAPGCLAAQVAALDARSDVGIVFGAVECVDEAGRPAATDASFETAARTEDELLPALLGDLRLAPAAALVRREVLLEAGGLDPLYTRTSAHDLWLRALASNGAVLLADRLARVRPPVADDPVERAERGLAALRALSRSGVARFLAGLGGAADRPPEEQGAARLALVDAILASRNEGLWAVVPSLVAAAQDFGARIGTARAERLVAAGLSGLPGLRSRGGLSSFERAATSGATSETSPTRSTAQLLRERRRLLTELASGIASEASTASRMTLLNEGSRRRIAGSAAVAGEAAVSGETILAQTSRIEALAEQLLEKLRIGKRLRRVVGVGADAPLASPAADPLRDGGGAPE
jgi:hypothetical protein